MLRLRSQRHPPLRTAPRGADGSKGASGTSDDAYWNAHDILAELEGGTPNEGADFTMVQAFGAPKEWRTMSRIDPRLIHLLAGIHARGVRNGSRFRQQLVQDYFLMMRSSAGHGAEQMVRVAQARNGIAPSSPEKGGFLTGWFGAKKEAP